MFFDEPRLCMGLNPNHRRVIRATAADEEERYSKFVRLHEVKEKAVELVEDGGAK